MRSKILFSLLLTLFSCQRFIDSAPPPEETVQFQSDKFECLNGLGPALKSIFQGQAKDTDVDSNAICVHQALLEFRDKTTDEVYTAGSLVRFLNSHLLKDNQISSSFQGQLMKVKRLFLGGDEETLTRQQVTNLIDILDTMAGEFKKVGPSLPLLFQDKKILFTTSNEIQKATSQVQSSLFTMYDKMKIEESSYTLQDGADLLKELSRFMGSDTVTAQLDDVRDLIPFVQICLDGAYGSQRQALTASELKQRTSGLFQGYGLYLEYNYLMQNNKAKDADELQDWIHYVDRILELVEKQSALSDKGLAYVDLNKVFSELYRRHWMPWPLKPTSFDKTIHMLFEKIGKSIGVSTTADAITLQEWKNIRWEYSQWRYAQLLFAQAPFPKNGISMPTLLSWMRKSAPLDAVIANESWTPSEKLALKNSWSELQNLLLQKRAIKYNTAGGIILVDTESMAGYTQTWTDLLRFNVVRTMNRMLFLGYSDRTDSFNLFSNGISEQRLTEWYTDFTPLGIDLKFFDPRTPNAGSRSFLEANNFTAYSDGNSRIDYNEGFQYVNYLFAAGLVNANSLYDTMKAQGCAMSEIDILGNPFLSETCFKDQLRKQYGQIYANLPYQVKWIQSLKDDEWNQFYDILMQAARTFPDNAGVKVETSDIRTLVTLTHYVESLYTQFDVNNDDILTDEEIKAGSVRFLPFLRTMRPGVPDILLKEGFITLVVDGKMPSLGDILAGVWTGVTHGREANRMNLLKVILVLKNINEG